MPDDRKEYREYPNDVDAADVDRIVEAIRPIIGGKPPQIQGAVIADLLSIFIAGHHPLIRDQVMKETVDCARSLIEPNVHLLFPDGPPPGWEQD